MQGTILTFHPETNKGLISGHDGIRYEFSRSEWSAPDIEPEEGLTVDFDHENKKAIQIIVLKKSSSRNKKSRTTAILLVLFLGWMGAHKFYLKQTGWGVLYLLFFWTAIPTLVSWVELIILILMGDSEFNRKFNY